MSNGGMDGFDWLQSFLPADSQPDHDSIANIEAYQAHLAFHDSEEVAKAAVMHQQAQRSYSFMRSTNPGTNHALNPSQVYSQASGGQYRGNQDQESSNVQSNNSASGPSVYPTHRSHNISQRPNPTSPSQHQLTSRVHQDAYRHGQTHMDPADPSQRPCKSISNSLEADKSPHRAHEITRPTAPPQRTNQNMARPLPASQNPYQGYSATPNQHSQMLDQSHMGQGMTAQGQRKYTPVARPQASQSPYQSHSTIPTQNVQRSSHSHTPPSSHSMDTELYNPLVSPKGFDTSAARSTPDPRQLITPTTSTREGSNPQTQNSVTNSTRSNPIPPRPSYQNYAHVQSAVPTAPNGVQSPATSQAVSTRSPSVSIVSSDPASAPPAPPAQITTVPHHLDKGRTQEKRGTQGKAPPTSLYQAPNQTSQQPPISEPNEQSTPAASSSFASSNPPAGPHPGPSYNSSYTSGPRRGTFSESAMAQQHAARNPQSRGYPLPGPLQHQKKRWVPTQEHLSGSMPPAKIRRLDNRTTQDGTLTSGSVKGAQISMEYPRPRGPGKILKNRDDLVQPIRRSDALPKHTYDPATIARDVLIAAGKHPTEKILNHHLEGLRRNFTKIHYLADLATFRWDLVDVKQPEPQVVDRMPPVPTPQIPLRPPPHPQPPQSAWQSLPRDPDAVIPNHVTVSDFAPMPSRDTPPNRPIAMPTRIDARAPPGGLSAWGTLPFKPPTYNPPQPIYSSNLPSGLPRVDPVPASPQSSHQSVPFPASPPPQPQQRRLSTAKSADPPKPPHTAKQSTPKSTAKPKPPAQTARSQSDSSRTVKSPETRRLPQPQVVIPYSPHKMPQNQKRRPGRPHKTGANHIEVAIHREQPVNYQIFPCKWEGCAAELHNIDSVRAHLIKVHIPHSLICKWKECGNKTPMAAADMFMHVSNEHISKMAWRLGDGPTVPIIAENKPSYPSVLGDRSARKGTMVLPVDEHQVKAFSKAHGKSTEKTKAQALLEAGRHWKQQVGPEMDWSDRRLSTPARQSRIHCGEMAFVGED
ncbi:hypothetical protein N7517_011652 [Penicillium concentricum]|uniref:C2H2-type domain-containing protein n=1 Tax=Penicillium concentricum TaxID=293559 RepID=A0A9W9RGF3_9EURO|nr:uncharacterized protein N7517_011652 [Penicillium concentricum]KAJ5357043.1 hypothetical protein N7517_011652 [Penicillium concentricum]